MNAPRRSGFWRRSLRVVLSLSIGLAVLLLALWFIVHWAVLPRAAQWKPWIEQRATQSLGQTVRIGELRVDSLGWVPALALSDVQVLDSQGRPALRLGRLQATLFAPALLALELRFSHLHVDGVQLDVRRDTQGRIWVAGLDTQADSDEPDDGRASDWLFAQHEIVIRHGTVRWTDERRAAPPLELSDVDLVLRNGLLSHDLRLDATPPPDWGQRLTLTGHFTHRLLQRRGEWRDWSGELHAELPAADVAQLHRHVQLPFDLHDGRGSVRAWLDLNRGQWRAATAELALADVQVRLASHLPFLSLNAMTGRVTATRQADGVALAVRQLSLTTGEGLVWPVGDVTLDWRQAQSTHGLASAASAPVTGGRFRADRLDLGVMASLATRLPLGRAMEDALRRFSPGGVVNDLDLRWTGAPEAPEQWQARGRLTGFVLPPAPAAQAGALGRPGIAGADADFDISDSGGKATLAMRQGALHFPGVFEDPALAMTELQARLEWRVKRRPQGRPEVELRVTEARFANDDAQGDLRAVWRTGRQPGFGPGAYLPGEIDLSGRIQRARAERVAAYLPLGIAAPVRRYVGRAVKAGVLDNGSFAVKGDVWHFPFNRGQPGLLRVAGRISDAQFDYLPSVPPGQPEPTWVSPWPGLANISGELLLERSSLSLDKMQGRLWGMQFSDVHARIDELGPNPLLHVQGEGRGPLADVLRFVDVSPVGQWLGGGLRPVVAQGVGELKLALNIPLLRPTESTVSGSVVLPGNDVLIRPDLPLLAAARGRVEFTHQGFQLQQASARALGGELTVEGGTQADGSLRFQAQGTATAEGLRRAREFAPLPQVAQALRGQAAWRAQLAIADGWPEVTVTSDLQGVHSDWPAPLNKTAEQTLPLRWQTRWVGEKARGNEAARDEVRLDLGNVAQLRLLREWQPEAPERGVTSRTAAASTVRVLGGTLGLGEAAAAPQTNGLLSSKGQLARLDADAWLRAWAALPAGEGMPSLPPLQVALQVDELLAAARRITHAQLQLYQDTTGGLWQAQVQADQLAGRLIWRPPQGLVDNGRLSARLSRLAVPPPQPSVADPLFDAGPARLPALDLMVDELEMRGRKLGRLNLQGTPRSGAAGREWSLERLSLHMPGGSLIGEGHWAPPPRPGALGRMTVNLSLNLQDSARLAAHLGWPELLRGGNGLIQGQLGWNGPALSPDFGTLEGQLSVALNQGQFLRAEPGGVGRLLGVLSLQSLPRRLLLDFRDVFQQGFAFDQVSGDVQVARGQAQTDNLRMRGLQATVFIDGKADLLRETQDLRVLIVPEVNAGAASLAYLAVNPAVGLGTFLAQVLLRDPLRAANTREFVVSGPMSDPKVERVERSASAALPTLPNDPPASAQPAPAASPVGPPTDNSR